MKFKIKELRDFSDFCLKMRGGAGEYNAVLAACIKSNPKVSSNPTGSELLHQLHRCVHATPGFDTAVWFLSPPTKILEVVVVVVVFEEHFVHQSV